MTKLDALIDQLLREVRVYEERVYDHGENELVGYTEVIQDISGEDYARRLEWKPEEIGRRFCAVRHQLFATPVGFSLNQYFPLGLPPEVALPPDVVHFYQRICHARLRWKADYILDPPGWTGKDEVGSEWGKVEPPNFLLRFCEVEWGSVYFALRTKDNGANWDVILIVNDDTDSNMALQEKTMDGSFTDWLERMMKSEGWPPYGGDPDIKEEDSGYFLKAERRLPTEVVMRKFGLPENLLPPARMETWQEGLK